MKIYDISMPIQGGMTVYKNKEQNQPVISTVTTGYVTESEIRMTVHTGSHIDAPLHMIENGKTFDQYAIDRFVGKCKVFDLSHLEDAISVADIEHLPIEKGDNILFKTKNSSVEEFDFEFVYVAVSAANFLVQKEVNLVGIDCLGIERAQEGHLTHKSLLGNNIAILEGLRLKDVPAGEYFMVAAPLAIVGTEASPARVLLIDEI